MPIYTGFCPYRACLPRAFPQGDALGWLLIAPSGRYRIHADNHADNHADTHADNHKKKGHRRDPNLC